MLSGALAVSFSPIAFSQSAGVQGSGNAGATVDLEKPKLPETSAQREDSGRAVTSGTGIKGSAGTGAGATVPDDSRQVEDKNPDSPGKGWAKGHERGKGHGANDERHGGRHSGSGSTSRGQDREKDRGKY
jgi:hypothetical protein